MPDSITCPHCGVSVWPIPAPVNAGVQTTVTCRYKNGEGVWWIGICPPCNGVILLLDAGRQVHPAPKPPPLDPAIPSEIVPDYLEAQINYSTQCYRSCAVMARRCLETACVLKGANGANLKQKVDNLLTQGIVTKDLHEWADTVRMVGNDAAHDQVASVTEEDADDILTLVDQFLDVVFVTPSRAAARRAARGVQP